ncbi:E3 ubiquitin-protein ligase RNF113A-like [Oppia nitens]|uniref:E3 ubiquitin-protein ligase RNF113A-like n=1 Tax=Oppia nitens TaxID=1686743 RepID=UPI0023D9A715|nr:E3 ubiquitin-protein ligase RNF113A-like [Oppia nitens]
MSSEEPSKESVTTNRCQFFVKKSNTNRRIRQKVSRQSSSSDASDEESSVVVKNRKRDANPMIQSTLSFNKLKKQKNNSETNDINEESDSEDKDSFRFTYRSNKSGQREGPEDMGATSIIQTETEKEKDAQSIYQKALEVNKELKGKEDDHIYRGINNYTQYVTKKDTPMGNASSGHVRRGPVRAPENIRSTVRWDYQPNICKDYKETGFCGFGDSCIFLHDRSDYKAGWQLELETQRKDDNDADEDPDKYVIQEDDNLPFKCLICRESFVSPVVTKCKHYFCEKCALNHFKKTGRCYVCQQQTGGVFNIAKELIKRLEQHNHELPEDSISEPINEFENKSEDELQESDCDDSED